MSLQVWLPLNGDFKNYGLAGELICPNILTFSASGKIGEKCLNSYTGWFSIPTMDNKKQMSFAYWVKINEGTTTNWKDIFTWYTTDGTYIPQNRQEMYSYNSTTNTMTTGVWYANGNENKVSAISEVINQKIGEWIHYAFTIDYNTGQTQFFVNGKFVNSLLNAGTSHYIKPGNSFRLRESDLNCSINDFRLYDHILSSKEIEEISKGLILHYKLNNTTTYTSSIDYNTVYHIYNNHNNTNMPSTLIKTEEIYLGSPVYRETCTPTSNSLSSIKSTLAAHGIYNWKTTFKANTKYVFWIYYKPISHSDTRCGGTASNISGWKEIPPVAVGDGWYRVGQYRDGTVTTDKTDNIFVSFKVPSATVGTPIVIDWAAPSLVEGTTEIQLDKFLTTTTVQDCSGYNNNGTIYGNLSLSNESIRYLKSTIFNGASAIVAGRNGMVKDAISVCCWGYMGNWSNYNARLVSCTEGGGWNFEPSSGKMNFACGTGVSSNTYKSVQSKTTLANLSSGWHHFVGTYDGLQTKIYIDGILENTNNAYSIKTPLFYNSSNGIFVGAEAASSITTPTGSYFNGKICDFRIYATALTETQIKELYSVSMTIDNKGNGYSREIIEDSSLKVDRQGIFHNDILIDKNDNNIASITKNKELKVNSFYEY